MKKEYYRVAQNKSIKSSHKIMMKMLDEAVTEIIYAFSLILQNVEFTL